MYKILRNRFSAWSRTEWCLMSIYLDHFHCISLKLIFSLIVLLNWTLFSISGFDNISQLFLSAQLTLFSPCSIRYSTTYWRYCFWLYPEQYLWHRSSTTFPNRQISESLPESFFFPNSLAWHWSKIQSENVTSVHSCLWKESWINTFFKLK